VLSYVLAGLDLNRGNIFYFIVGWLVVCIGRFVYKFLGIQLVCGIVLFRAVIIMFVAVGVVLIVGTCCTSVISAAPICTSSRSYLWTSQQVLSEHGFGGTVV
jgi:hypothetical protein